MTFVETAVSYQNQSQYDGAAACNADDDEQDGVGHQRVSTRF
jgi:hypothetical protein